MLNDGNLIHVDDSMEFGYEMVQWVCRRINLKGGQVLVELLFVLAVSFEESRLVLREEFGGFAADLGAEEFVGLVHDLLGDGNE